MLADLEAGPPGMPYRLPPTPAHWGVPPGVPPPMPGHPPMGQPVHLHGPPPVPFVPCMSMPMGVPGIHPMLGPGCGFPAHVQHNLQCPQQLQPLPAHPTWQERFGHPAQLHQQQQEGFGPAQQQQPRLAAAASGDQQGGLEQLQPMPAEQQQDPVRQGGLRLRIVLPRGMQQRLSSPGEQARQQQQQPREPQHTPVGASGQDGLQMPPAPPSTQQDQQQDQPGQEAAAVAAGRRAQRKSAQQQHREAATAAAAAAAALRGDGPGAGHGQPAAAAAAADARIPPGLRSVRFTREVAQVDIFMGVPQQHRCNAAAPWAGNQQQQRAGYGVSALRGGEGASQRRLEPEQYFRRCAVDTNPFWGSAVLNDSAGVLATTTLQPPAGSTPGSTAVAKCELAVTLSTQQVQQLQAGTAVVQLWCFKLGDPVPCRVHWPYTNQQLQVNDARANPTMAKRLKVGELQPYQGDLQVDVTHHALASTGLPANRLSGHARVSVLLSAQVTAPPINAPYAGGYVLGCRLVRARSIQEVKDMMAEPPELAEAVNELQQKLAGDEDVIAAATTVATRCAASMVPMQTPANFGTGEGLVCFDLDNYLEMTQKSGKWQCPGTRKFHTWRTLQTSPFMAAVLQSLEEAGLKDSVTHVEVTPDAKWRPQGAVRSCCFDVLHPPTSQQILASLQPGAAALNAAGKIGELLAESDLGSGGGGGRAAKRQRREPQKQVIVIDSDSDDEPPMPAAAAAGKGQVPRQLPGAAAAAQGGSAGAAAAAGPAGGRNAQQPAHRHAHLPQASRAEWMTQAEVVRRAQQCQRLRLVRQGSDVGGMGPFTAILLEGADDEQQQQQQRGHTAAAGHESTGSGHISNSLRGMSDSEDEPYNPFADLDEEMEQDWGDSAGAGRRSVQQQDRRGRSKSTRAAQALRQDRTVDAMLAAVTADLCRGNDPADEAAAGDLRSLQAVWRACRWPSQQQQQQQQQRLRQPMPAPCAPAQQETEVIEILSDSD